MFDYGQYYTRKYGTVLGRNELIKKDLHGKYYLFAQ